MGDGSAGVVGGGELSAVGGVGVFAYGVFVGEGEGDGVGGECDGGLWEGFSRGRWVRGVGVILYDDARYSFLGGLIMTQTASAEKTNGAQGKGISLVDSDVHNYPDSIGELVPYLAENWRAYIKQSGFNNLSVSHYPKVYAQAARRDSFPLSGKRPGADPEFARQQLLDTWGIDIALLNPLVAVSAVHNIDFANALNWDILDLPLYFTGGNFKCFAISLLVKFTASSNERPLINSVP